MSKNVLIRCAGIVYFIVNIIFVYEVIAVLFLWLIFLIGPELYWLSIFAVEVLLDIKLTDFFLRLKRPRREYVIWYICSLILSLVFFVCVGDDTLWNLKYVFWEFVAHSGFYCYKVKLLENVCGE